LEVLAKHKYPVNIGTKATLVKRDVDLLSQIGSDTWCAVSITITTTDDDLSKFLEPEAPAPEQRFETIKDLKKENNIQVGINFMPIVPFLWDSDENLEEMVRRAKNAGADYILFAAGMTMRDNQAKWFFKRLQEDYPELVDRYLKLYNAKITPGKSYEGSYGPNKSYTKRITKKMIQLYQKYNINCRMKRFIPEDFRKYNYLIAEEFLNEAFILQYTGKPYTSIFWAGQNIQNLKESIVDVAARDELQSIRNVNGELENRINGFLSRQKIPRQLILPKE
jgi:DNA repair photolyase